MKAKVVTEIPFKLPRIILGDGIMRDVGEEVATGVQTNILKQQRATGAPLEKNKQSTINTKRKLFPGRPINSLIFKDRKFLRSSTFKVSPKNNEVVVGFSTDELENIARDLQRGTKGRNKYVGWMGVSKETHAAIVAKVKKYLKNYLARFARNNSNK